MKASHSGHEARFILITLGIVVALGAASWMTMTTPPAIAQRTPELARGPAGKPSAPVSEVKSTESVGSSNLKDIAWDCKKSNPARVGATHIRLKGKPFCKNERVQQLKILNKTNGFTASVFLNEKGFLTDYIDLKVGSNDISIEWTDHKGKSNLSSLQIVRE